MSDRDKKIILFLLIVAVIALPYVFVIKEKRIETEAVKAQNIELQARLDYLNELNEQRDFYISETERINKECAALINTFPADIRQENYTMFLLNTEYSSDLIMNEETGDLELEYPIIISSVSYGTNDVYPIAEEYVEEGSGFAYNTVSNRSSFDYACYYDGLKYMLAYFMDYKDPMTYRAITIDFDPATGICAGSITLDQYAISGEGRELENVEIWPDLDKIDLRGNEEVGIFGPVFTTGDEEEETETAVVEETVEAE